MNFLWYLIAAIPLVYFFYGIFYEYYYKERYLPKKYERDLTDKVRWIVIQSLFGFIGNHRTYKNSNNLLMVCVLKNLHLHF